MPIRRPDVSQPMSSRRRYKVREELVSAVKEKYEAYLATAN